MPRTAAHPSAFICERCGYALAGIDPRDTCSECGTPAQDSLPSRRTGSAYQRTPTLRAALATAWHSLRHPRRTFSLLDTSPSHDSRLRITLAAVAALLGVPAAINLIDPLALWLFVIGGPHGLAENLVAAAITAPILFLTILGLTRVEQQGIAFFGPRRGWRITKPLARAITAHATAGWIVGTALASTGLALGYGLERLAIHTSTGALNDIFLIAPYALAALGFLLGMLLFETLTFVGMLHCKHANPPSAVTLDRESDLRPQPQSNRRPDHGHPPPQPTPAAT